MTTQTQEWTALIRRGADKLRSKLPTLLQVRPDHGLAAGLNATMARMDRPFVLAVVGEFRSGKSTLINALLEDEVALTGAMETTPIAIEYAWGEKTEAEIVYQNGQRELCPIQALNRQIDVHRHDLTWLGAVAKCRVAVPHPLLQNMTLWDSPGFGGSDHNQERAEAFLKDIDAALWVFDITVLGQSALAPLLADLRQRGKPVVALLNKADAISAQDLDRTTAYIGRAYKGIVFERITPFSATRACQPERARDGDAAVAGTRDGLAADGGRRALIDYLQNELLVEPEMLRLAGVAGDLGYLALSAAEDFRTIAAGQDRRLYLCRQKLEQVAEQSLRIRNELSVRFREELPVVLEEASIEQIDDILGQTNGRDLFRNGVLGKEIGSRLSPAFYEQRITTYFRSQQAEIEDAWNRIDQELDLGSSLEAPFEHLAHEAAGVSSSVRSSLSNLSGFRGDGGIQKFASPGRWGSAAVGSIGPLWAGLTGHMGLSSMFLTLGGIIAGPVLGLLGWGVSRIFGGSAEQAESSRYDQIREKLRNPVRDSAEDVTRNVVDPYLDRLHEAVLKDMSVATCHRELDGREIGTVARYVGEFNAHASDCQAIHEQLREISQVAPSPASEESVKLPADHLADGERWFKRIFDGAREQIAIVDRDLGPGALELLRLASDIVPIQVLTYTHPMSFGLAGPFREAAASLRQRPGSVRIRVPQYEPDHESPLKGNTCWIFTGEYCYHLDRSLNRFGSEDIIVEVARDTGAQFDEHFARWWDNRVEGVQTLEF